MPSLNQRARELTRRKLFQQSGVMVAAAGIAASNGTPAAAANTTAGLQLGPNIYESIGVMPIINARGTFTIITGSLTLPEVKRAMDEASRHYVQMDELMEGVSRRLAELTKAEWGLVTAGCCAAITHATAACIAGANPEKMQKLPYLDGLKNEVVIPKHSRNVYDRAARMLGVKIVEVNSEEELQSAFNPKTAMIYILSSPRADSDPLSTENICKLARANNVPVFVDAAAEALTIPNKHLLRGATMVAYSGGKCLRGPQAAGLLLGPKDLLQAAWLNSAPHHAYGRSLKVGKEEIMGMLAAVEMWTRRDHDAEWKQWESWLGYIKDRVTSVPGVTTEVHQPEDLSNHTPTLRIAWDGAALGITGREVEELLMKGKPRITVAGGSGARPDSMASSVAVCPYMMNPEDHKIVAEALHALLSKPPKIAAPARPAGQPDAIAGQWDAHLEFVRGSDDHKFVIEQDGNSLSGTHSSEFRDGALHGSIYGNQVGFRSMHRAPGDAVGYDFTGTVDGNNAMSGTVTMGEYWSAQWKATRRG